MNPRFKTFVGTGGIGSGAIYRLEGNHDLGRGESRMGHLLDQKDFCKLHIIFHYVSVYLKGAGLDVKVLPIGAVGADSCGNELMGLMKKTGMDMRHVQVMKDVPTLYSVCYQFLDHSGGNMTESRSASSRLSVRQASAAAEMIADAGKECLVMAAPEVPLNCRLRLLRIGKQAKAFTAASFNSEEITNVGRGKSLRDIDLLAINLDEAASLAGCSAKLPAVEIVERCASRAMQFNPAMLLSITADSRGIFGVDRGTIEHLPILNVRVVNTAGAGDAAFAGVICGLTMGLPFIGSAPCSCLKLARLFSAMSVTSANTIHFGLNFKSLNSFAKSHRQIKRNRQ